MSEKLELRDPLFKLIVRFTNGETNQHVLTDPMDSGSISSDARFAIITSVSIDRPYEVSEFELINLRDVTLIKTERSTVEELITERRKAGLRAPDSEEKSIKTVAQIRFI